MTNVASKRAFAAALLASLLLHAGMSVLFWRQRPARLAAPSPTDRLIVKLQASAREADASPGPGESTSASAHRPSPAAPKTPDAGREAQSAVGEGIDLDAARETARRLARTDSRGREAGEGKVLAMEAETPLGKAISRSLRVDCRQAYAGAGLLAIPLLARDAILDSGCNW